MKRLRVVFFPLAQADLLACRDYIRRDSPSASQAWIARVDKALGRLGEFPKSGTIPKDARLAAQGYRIVVIGEHLAFYVVGRREVEVGRVLHGRRRYGFLL